MLSGPIIFLNQIEQLSVVLLEHARAWEYDGQKPEPEIFEQKALVCLKVICTGVSIAYLLANTFAT